MRPAPYIASCINARSRLVGLFLPNLRSKEDPTIGSSFVPNYFWKHIHFWHTHTPIHQTVGKNTQQQETPEPWYRCLGSWCFAPDVWRVFVLLCAITTSAPERDGSAARVKKLWTAGGLMMGWSLLPFFILLLLFFPCVLGMCVCVFEQEFFFSTCS